MSGPNADDDVAFLTPEQRARRGAERRHFIFASILILGCMLVLPIAGIVYFVLMKLGAVATPFR